MNDKPFVHLHCHSHYSLLDGANKVGELIPRVKALGMPAVAWSAEMLAQSRRRQLPAGRARQRVEPVDPARLLVHGQARDHLGEPGFRGGADIRDGAAGAAALLHCAKNGLSLSWERR